MVSNPNEIDDHPHMTPIDLATGLINLISVSPLFINCSQISTVLAFGSSDRYTVSCSIISVLSDPLYQLEMRILALQASQCADVRDPLISSS